MEIKEKTRMRDLPVRFLSLSSSGVLIFLALIVIAVSALAPIVTGGSFFTANNLIKILRQVTTTGIIACAVTLVMLTGNIDLSVGSILTLTGCVSATMVQYGLAAAIFVPLIVGALCGLLNGFLVSYVKLNPFITTIATLNIYQALAYLYTSSQYLVPAANGGYEFIGKGYLFGVIPMPVVILAAVAAVYWFVLKRTAFGARLFAIGANRTSARFSGVRTRVNVMAAYLLSGLTTALAAVVMVSRVMSAQSQMGGGYEFDVVTAVVLGGTSMWGGKGGIPGTILGVVFVGVLANAFVLLGLNTNMQWLIEGVVLVLALRFDIIKERGLKI